MQILINLIAIWNWLDKKFYRMQEACVTKKRCLFLIFWMLVLGKDVMWMLSNSIIYQWKKLYHMRKIIVGQNLNPSLNLTTLISYFNTETNLLG